MGSNLLPQYPARLRSDAILYNLEQVQLDSPWFNPALVALFRRFAIWDYCSSNVLMLKQMSVSRVTHVPIGFAPVLQRIVPAEESLDVLFVGSLNQRRLAVIHELKRRGLRAEAFFAVYGNERDRLIARAKIILNMHYYESKIFEIVRVSYLLANRRFVISERGVDSAEDEQEFGGGLVFADYERLADVCAEYAARRDERCRIADAGFEIMSARPITKYLHHALEALGRSS